MILSGGGESRSTNTTLCPEKWNWSKSVSSEKCHSAVSNSLWPHGLVHGILQARILEWVAFPFYKGIFPTQGLNPGLPHCRQILYQLSHKGSPGILEWVAYSFSRGSSQPRNWSGVTHIAGGFFTNWAIREARPCISELKSLNPHNHPMKK